MPYAVQNTCAVLWANMTISTNGPQHTDPTVQIMRLEQNADAYHCEIVLVLFGEKQHNDVYWLFHPLTIQKCCWSKHLKSEV